MSILDVLNAQKYSGECAAAAVVALYNFQASRLALVQAIGQLDLTGWKQGTEQELGMHMNMSKKILIGLLVLLLGAAVVWWFMPKKPQRKDATRLLRSSMEPSRKVSQRTVL